MKGHIEHTGRVQRTEGDKVFVAITSNSACSGCRAREACGVSESAEKIIEVTTAAAAEFSEGEEVVVSVRKGTGLRAVFYAYTVPLAVLIAVLAGVKAAGCEDGTAALSALGAVAVYYLALWLLRSKTAEKVNFSVRKI